MTDHNYPICKKCGKKVMPAGSVYASNTTMPEHCECKRKIRGYFVKHILYDEGEYNEE